VDGLRFFDLFKAGDIDGCIAMMHPDIEWYPTPDLTRFDVRSDAEEVRRHLESLYDRFSTDIEVHPEHGWQAGQHMLLVTILRGRNWFTKQPVEARKCWVVTLRDGLWVRVVEYPNGPVAQIAFEELVKTSGG
jgi:ketosteroid isomerase-like protein